MNCIAAYNLFSNNDVLLIWKVQNYENLISIVNESIMTIRIYDNFVMLLISFIFGTGTETRWDGISRSSSKEHFGSCWWWWKHGPWKVAVDHGQV